MSYGTDTMSYGTDTGTTWESSVQPWCLAHCVARTSRPNTKHQCSVYLCFACMHSMLLCIVKTGYYTYWRILQEYLTFKFTACRCWDSVQRFRVDCSLKYLSVWELLGKHVAWSSQCRAVAFSHFKFTQASALSESWCQASKIIRDSLKFFNFLCKTLVLSMRSQLL